jgi:DHA1 family tetracycline resistance protein-like MFS transporter
LYLRRVAGVVLCYYSGVWALVTTLVVYAVRVFGLSTVQVGYLLSLYGLCTMVAESVIVRYAVPLLGELPTARLGLLAFAAQCCIVAGATSPEPLFASVALSLVSNLVYPALSALVARRAEATEVGEALGALNGVKALTEGVGPLGFGLVMVEFERTALPGLPYLACAALALLAWALSHRLPDLQKDEDEGDEELVGLLAADDGGVAAEDAAAMEKRRLKALVAGYAPPLTLSPAAFAAGSGSSAPEREVPPAA